MSSEEINVSEILNSLQTPSPLSSNKAAPVERVKLDFINPIESNDSVESSDAVEEVTSPSEDTPSSPVVEETVPEAPALVKSLEERAREQRWVPKDEFNGNPDDWVDAKEFIARGSFFKKIDKQKKELEEQKLLIQDLIKTMSTSEERAYKKALKDIENGKLHAKSNRDIEAYEHFTEKEKQLSSEYNTKLIEQAKATSEEANKPSTNILETKEFKEFALTNPFITSNDPSCAFAKVTATELSKEWGLANPGVYDLKSELAYINSRIRKIHTPERFPELYGDKVTPTTSKVESPKGGNASSRQGSSVVSLQGLTDFEIGMVDRLKRDGLNWKIYVKELQNIKTK